MKQKNNVSIYMAADPTGAALDLGKTAITGFLNNATLNDSSSLQNRINSVKNYRVAAGDNDALMNEWGNFSNIGWISRRDAGGKSFGEVGMNALSSGVQGGLAGASMGGPWGAAAGAVIGAGSALWGGLAGSFSARRKQRELQRKANEANATAYSSFTNAADRIESNADAAMQSTYYGYGGFLNHLSNVFGDGGGIHINPANKGKFTESASRAGMGVQEYASHILANKEDYSSTQVKRANFAHNAAKWHDNGGYLMKNSIQYDEGGNLNIKVPNYSTHGGAFSNGVTIVENGGTHEENQLGGVPVSIDPQGKPNLVEEGEAIYKDYVFSNRLKPTKAMASAFNLKDTSFADNFISAQKESSERPNDPISKNGLESSFNIMKNLQESIKQAKNKNKKQSPEGNKFFDGSQMFEGIKNYFSNAKSNLDSGDTNRLDDLLKTDPWRYSGIAGQGIQVIKDMFGANKPDYSNVNAIEKSYSPINTPRIDNYLTYKPFDTSFYANKTANQNAALRRSIANASAGNRSSLIANQIAANNSATAGMGDMYRKAEEANLNQRQMVENFNRSTNMANSDISFKEQAANNDARMRMAMATAQMRENIAQGSKSAIATNYSNLLNQFSDLGKERSDRNMIKWMAESGLFGNGTASSKETKLTDSKDFKREPQTYSEDNKEYDQYGNEINTKKCGGKLKKRTTRKGLTF